MTDTPLAVCLCPTYGRPQHLIANTIACFKAQTYPNKRLLICDDLGNLVYNNRIPDVLLMQQSERFPSLPAKYNAMLGQVVASDAVIVVWEDDDLYLPHHIHSCVEALKSHEWAHPKTVWSTYTGKPEIEYSGGRFHASLAFRLDFLNKIGGWPETDAPDFDQQLIALAAQNAPCGHPNADSSDFPSYVFRWSDTGSQHGQAAMPDGGRWYQNYHPGNTKSVWIGSDTARHDEAATVTIAEISKLVGR